MLQIIYSSAAVVPFSELELQRLLLQARENNTRLGVTGMLLYQEGSFLQVVEGEGPLLETLFQRIAADKRHQRVITLLRREVEARHFGDWAMGFVSPEHLTQQLPGYSDYLRLRGQPQTGATAAERVLSSFREGRFRNFVKSR
jgi:hypothetical protein